MDKLLEEQEVATTTQDIEAGVTDEALDLLQDDDAVAEVLQLELEVRPLPACSYEQDPGPFKELPTATTDVVVVRNQDHGEPSGLIVEVSAIGECRGQRQVRPWKPATHQEVKLRVWLSSSSPPLALIDSRWGLKDSDIRTVPNNIRRLEGQLERAKRLKDIHKKIEGHFGPQQ